jgi:endonuclease III
MSQLLRPAEICHLLDVAYGQPDLGNHDDPVDELIYILLSTMTTEANYQRSFASLRARLPSWEEVLAAPVEDIQEAISAGGLAPTKARFIQALLARLQNDWGGFDLSFMRSWPTIELRRYLATLPGIGYKAATCVIAYSFGRDVCPVDTHTYRATVRLGLVPSETPELGRRAHVTIERAIPLGQRLAFHINAVAHGRQRCHLVRPECDGCPVAEQCVAPERGRYSRRAPATDGE